MALTEEQKRRNKIIRANKKLTSEEIAKAVHSWNISYENAERVIDRVRDRIKDNKEWYDIYRWSIEEGETETKSWASIYVQAYGYDYTTHYTLDTGFNKYETTIFNSEGWYTE